MKINLITSDGKPWFTNRIKEYPGVIFKENSFEDENWDVVAVYENTIFPKVSFRTKYLILLSGEPPHACVYPHNYISQFDKVVTCNHLIKHKDVIHEQPSEPIHIGRSWKSGLFLMNYEDLRSIEKPSQLLPISLMASTLNWLPGHRKRMALVNGIIESGLPVDVYGRGRKYVDDKKDAILPYMFHVCIENDCIEDYWTEKIADTIVCKTIPIYYGCPNIDKYFDRNCMFVAESEKDFVNIIKGILKDPVDVYQDKLPFILRERKKLFEDYNIINTIKHCGINEEKEIRQITVSSKESFISYQYLVFCNAMKLKIKKIFNL